MTDEFAPIAEPFIVGEKADCVAVFKPAGMHSLPSGKGGEGEDILSWYAHRMPEARDAFGSEAARDEASELGMISRLDRGTSGIILFARTPALRGMLFNLAARGGIRKIYRLLSTPSGKPLPGCLPGLMRPELPPVAGKDGSPQYDSPGWAAIESFFRSYGEKGARVACIHPDRAGECRRKLTRKTYTTLIRAAGKNPADGADTIALSALIHSGFRHQIRAHLAWSGLPILGDRDYGGRDAPRLCLEAHRIELDANSGREAEIFELYGESDES
jgi:23S rRNA pseudouridine1911/1915/1917 synthase